MSIAECDLERRMQLCQKSKGPDFGDYNLKELVFDRTFSGLFENRLNLLQFSFISETIGYTEIILISNCNKFSLLSKRPEKVLSKTSILGML